MTSPTTLVEGLKGKGSHKLLAGVVIVLGLIMAAVVLFSHRGLYQIYRFGQERLHLEQENARLAEDNARLARTIDRLQHDPEMIQEVIRRELNFVKKNEIIFQLPPGSGSKPTATPSLPSAATPDKHPAKAGVPPVGGKQSGGWNSLEGAPKPSSRNAR